MLFPISTDSLTSIKAKSSPKPPIKSQYVPIWWLPGEILEPPTGHSSTCSFLPLFIVEQEGGKTYTQQATYCAGTKLDLWRKNLRESPSSPNPMKRYYWPGTPGYTVGSAPGEVPLLCFAEQCIPSSKSFSLACLILLPLFKEGLEWEWERGTWRGRRQKGFLFSCKVDLFLHIGISINGAGSQQSEFYCFPSWSWSLLNTEDLILHLQRLPFHFHSCPLLPEKEVRSPAWDTLTAPMLTRRDHFLFKVPRKDSQQLPRSCWDLA